MSTTTARATIAIVPRERISATPATLAGVLATVPRDVPVVCIDAGHSRADRRRLRTLADDRTRVVTAPRWRTPNEARNIAMQYVATELVVFIDNDVLVREGWFEALVDCAEHTGAWAVTPLTLKGDWDEATVHTAGGALEWQEQDGERHLLETRHEAQRPVADVLATAVRHETGLAELHCVLVRSAVLEKLGGWDEGLMSTHEETDLSLAVTEAGGTIWFEPASVVTYVPPPPLAVRDLPFYVLRRSETWNRRSLVHFEQKWAGRISPLHTRWLRKHRFRMFLPLLRPVARVAGEGAAEGLRVRVLTPIESLLNRVLGAALDRLRP